MRAVGNQPGHPLKKTKRRKKERTLSVSNFLLPPPKPSQRFRSADGSQRQGPDTPLVRDQWIKSHLCGICGAPSLHAIPSYQG
jgi:hypothetical protein